MPSTFTDNPVLIIEDNPVTREWVTAILQREGYQPILAGDAREALTLLRGGLRPCLIMLDMILPNADGWTFFAERPRYPEVAAIPVIIMTALGVASPEWARSLGAVDLLRKPFAPSSLLAAVRTHARPEGVSR